MTTLSLGYPAKAQHKKVWTNYGPARHTTGTTMVENPEGGGRAGGGGVHIQGQGPAAPPPPGAGTPTASQHPALGLPTPLNFATFLNREIFPQNHPPLVMFWCKEMPTCCRVCAVTTKIVHRSMGHLQCTTSPE